MRALLGIALCALGLLAACATLTKEECRAGNWFDIGVEDGANGRVPGFLAAHAKACADLGITPDQTAWEKGRQAGLPRYCTPQRAYDVGRKGRDLSPVCPASRLPALETANTRGQEWHRITERILDLEDEIRDINAELRALDAGQEARALSLRSDRQFLRLRILSLEADRRRVRAP